MIREGTVYVLVEDKEDGDHFPLLATEDLPRAA